MKKILVFLLANLVCAGCALPRNCSASTNISLAKEQHTSYVIAVAADAIPAEKNAAQQLQQYLQEVTGATFPIEPESTVAADAPQILVGEGVRVKALLPQQDWNSLGSDGIIIKTVGNKLILAGGRPRGTLYAVFQFLEDNVGCHWWAPKEMTVPRKSTLEILPQDVVYVPAIDYREYGDTIDPLFATAARQNGDSQTQTPEWGGHHNMLGFVHTFSRLLPPSKYFKDHPEWYSDPDNGNKPCTASSKMPEAQHTQLSLSNPEVLDELTKQALLWIKANPDAGYISISQNDNGNFCQTPESLQLYKQEGSWSGPVLNFINQVADRIHQQYPNFLVETLAYSLTLTPPKTIRPAPNVIVCLASLHADYGHPIDSEWNAPTRDSFLQWSKISPRIFLWAYVTDFYGYLLPYPDWDSFAKNMRFFAAHKVTGVFLEGSHAGGVKNNEVGDFIQLRIWLTSKLMWNPALDRAQLTDEFLRGYYGAAGPYLGKYLDLVQEAFLKQHQKLISFNIDWTYLTLDDMNQATRLFDQAADAVKDDPVFSARVRRERLQLDLLWLLRYKTLKQLAEQSQHEFLGPKNPDAVAQNFISGAKQEGMLYYDIIRTSSDFIPTLGGMYSPPAALPDFAKQYPASDVIDFQDGDFTFFSYGKSSGDEEDPAASDQKAAWASAPWAIEARFNQALPGPEQETYHVYAMVRVPLPATDGVKGTISMGIYDQMNAAGVSSQSVPLEQVTGDGYHRIDLGVHPLNGSMYIWFSPAANVPGEKVYVDRIILIREKQ